jgi:hypothetical protein
MTKTLVVLMSVATLAVFAPVSEAANCPPEVAQAKTMLTKKVAAAQDVQAPRSLAGARQNIQAGRGQDVQAGRGQDVQAGRGQDVQAGRGQDAQAGRGQDAQAGRGQDAQAGRGQDVQAGRGQDVQAGRGQDVQAGRGQDVQAGRGQDVQAGRGQDVQAGRAVIMPTPHVAAPAKTTAAVSSDAGKLVKEAEAACAAGDMKTAKAKADAAIAILK